MPLTDRFTRKQITASTVLLLLLIIYGISIMNRHTDYWVFELAAERLLNFEGITRYENMAYSYPPLFAVLALPVTLLPTVLGSWIFYLLSWISFGVAVQLTVQIYKNLTQSLNLSQSNSRWILIISFLLSGRYILNNFEHLQFDVFVFLCLVLTVHFYLKGNWIPSALFLALSISLKVTPLLLLAFFFFRRDFKLTIFTVLFLIVLNTIPELIFGWSRGVSYNWEWIRLVVLKLDAQHLSSDDIAAIWPPNSIMNQSVKPWIYRLFTDNVISIKGENVQPNMFSFSPQISSLVAAAFNGLLILSASLLLFFRRRTSPITWFAQISLILCLMLLLSPVSSKPHFVTLVFAHLFIFTELIKRGSKQVFIYSAAGLFFVLGFLPPLLGSFADQWCQMVGFTTLHALLAFGMVFALLMTAPLHSNSAADQK